jgi:hypothetical protein
MYKNVLCEAAVQVRLNQQPADAVRHRSMTKRRVKSQVVVDCMLKF